MTKPIRELKEKNRATPKALYVFGEWISGYGKELISYDPYSGDVVWQAPAASVTDVSRAVKGAAMALPLWSATPLEKRIDIVQAYKKALEEASPKLTAAISKETGKPTWEAKTEVAAMMGKVDISIKAYEERCPTNIQKQKGLTTATRHKPHGVLAVLGPFNFPGHLPNGHIVPALLAGNTIVFKPSELTPLVSEIMVQCWIEAGLPTGVINLIPGTAEIGKALATHDEINGLLFTGSYNTGQKLLETFAKTPQKILALEMGGNNPLVVSGVKDLKAAALMTIQSAFLTAGQRCTCARRLIVHNQDDFIETLVEMMKKIRVGHYKDDPEPFMGPVISQPAAVRAVSMQATWELYGGKSLVKLKHLQEGTGRVTPGLIDVTHLEKRFDEEIFGPLLQVIRVDTFEEAIAEANNTKFGLSAGLFSDSSEQYETFYRQIRAGVVNWNRPLTGASSAAPFGGIGCSGNHRPSAFYAADYCAYPVASMESEKLEMPKGPIQGLK